MKTALITALLLAAAPGAVLADETFHHPAIAVQEIQPAGYDYASKFYPHPAWFHLLAEAPRLLFPFARQIVADAIQNLGFPPLLLDPIDFGAAYMQQLQAQQGEGQLGGNGANGGSAPDGASEPADAGHETPQG